jgi:hypothetical protein
MWKFGEKDLQCGSHVRGSKMVFIFALGFKLENSLPLDFSLLKTTIMGIPPRSSKLGISLGLGFPYTSRTWRKSPNYIWRAPSMHEYPS